MKILKTTAVLAVSVVLSLTGTACALKGATPPPTPHSIEGSYENCAGCHENGSQGAPKTDHAKKNDCTSCHHATRT